METDNILVREAYISDEARPYELYFLLESGEVKMLRNLKPIRKLKLEELEACDIPAKRLRFVGYRLVSKYMKGYGLEYAKGYSPEEIKNKMILDQAKIEVERILKG